MQETLKEKVIDYIASDIDELLEKIHNKKVIISEKDKKSVVLKTSHRAPAVLSRAATS